MNRDELDAFFAKAEDVLTDWEGSVDSMNSSPPSQQFLDFVQAFSTEPTPWQRSVLELFNHERYDYLAYRNLVLVPLRITMRTAPVIITSVV